MKEKIAFVVASLQVLILAFFILSQSFQKFPLDWKLPSKFNLPQGATLGEQIATENEALVTEVIDGDTIRLFTGATVRYIGIDTPETNSPRKKNECFAKEAKEKNRELVEGKVVRLEKDVSETDKYGRLLRYVYIEGTMINDRLVREGYAAVSTFPPDVKYQNLFRVSEQNAREKGLGLWSVCAEK